MMIVRMHAPPDRSHVPARHSTAELEESAGRLIGGPFPVNGARAPVCWTEPACWTLRAQGGQPLVGRAPPGMLHTLPHTTAVASTLAWLADAAGRWYAYEACTPAAARVSMQLETTQCMVRPWVPATWILTIACLSGPPPYWPVL